MAREPGDAGGSHVTVLETAAPGDEVRAAIASIDAFSKVSHELERIIAVAVFGESIVFHSLRIHRTEMKIKVVVEEQHAQIF